MSEKPIRVLVMDAAPKEGGAMPRRASEVHGIEVVGVSHNRQAALAQVEELQPDVLLVDVMLPGLRSIDLVRQVARSQPQVHILAVTPDDPPHDRIMLATEGGALGFISRHAPSSDYQAAIEMVHQGELWLPPRQTYEVLQEGAGELAVSSQERRGRLTQVILGLIPLTGLVAAITAFLWRRYWGDIGVRVADLGIDPSSRMIDVLVVFVMIIGIFGPLLYVRPWVKALGKWIAGQRRLSRAVAKVRGLHLGKLPVGRLIVNYWVAWVLGLLVVLSVTLLLTRLMTLIMVLFVGPAVGILLVANVLELDDELPGWLHLPHLDSWRVLGFLGLILIVFLLALGAEVLITGPDLRADGLHGILAPKVLGFRATPVMLYDLDEKHEPLGALYLGGNADLYVLYDPCAETVRLVPVGASRVELIDRVDCRSP
jgi:DNA-binding NarL/FixJ family response regulator